MSEADSIELLRYRLEEIHSRISKSCQHVRRTPEEVLLLLVTKAQPVELIRACYDFGLRSFGENRVQELVEKKDKLSSDISWQMIGHLQTNKAKYLAPFCSMVQSVDSISLAQELDKHAGRYSRTIDILLQVNISHEKQKSGIEPDQTEELALSISRLCKHLRLKGLMGIASQEGDIELVRPQFESLRRLQNELQRRADLSTMSELSMGMSNDFEVAIEEGATIIRIGSALFGNR